jgi:hypothetical protein
MWHLDLPLSCKWKLCSEFFVKLANCKNHIDPQLMGKLRFLHVVILMVTRESMISEGL